MLNNKHAKCSCQNSQSGFMALMSTMIVTTVLLGLAFTMSGSAFMLRSNVLDIEHKRVSLGLAESCINIALLKISQNYNYGGGEIIDFDDDECTVKPVAYDIETINHKKIATISTSANYRNTFSNLLVTASILDPSYPFGTQRQITINSWREI